MSDLSVMSASEFWLANGAMALANILFGSVGVATTILGFRGLSPLLFGTLRTALTALTLVIALPCSSTIASSGTLRELFLNDGWRLAAMSASLFGGQFCLIIGVPLAGPVMAALTQPVQPVFTVLLTGALGLERITPARALGLTFTLVGCLTMTLGSAPGVATPHGTLGNLTLLTSSVSSSLYIIVSKKLLRSGHPPLVLAIFSFIGCIVFFSIALGGFKWLAYTLPELHDDLLCSDHLDVLCGVSSEQGLIGWSALAYVTIVGTALPYRWPIASLRFCLASYRTAAFPCLSCRLELFANRVIHSSLVSSYHTLQPVAAGAANSVVAPRVDLRYE